MKKIIDIEELGKVEVNQNWFTGRFSFVVNNKELFKRNKTTYVLKQDDEELLFFLNGNSFKGFYLTYGGKQYKLTEPIEWYFIILTMIPFLMTMTLGSLTPLAEAGFYYVGGAVGGLISGAFTGFALYFCTITQKKWIKLLICLGAIILTFLVCLGVGNLIVHIARESNR